MPLVVFAGAEYGNGSSRDWAAKGTKLLGVRAVIAESFERIHRSNLVGMGVLPLTFEPGTTWKTLGLKGDEQVTIHGLGSTLKPRQTMEAEITFADGQTWRKCRCSAASRRSTSLNISTMAGSLPTSCASSRPPKFPTAVRCDNGSPAAPVARSLMDHDTCPITSSSSFRAMASVPRSWPRSRKSRLG